MRWLHISDIHCGNSDPNQKLALDSIVKAIEEYTYSKPFDLVIITGDLAFSGKESEYQYFFKNFLSPLHSLEVCQNSIFLSVPGNHDIDCDNTIPTSWELLGKNRQNKFFQLTEEGKQARSARAIGFRDYSNFFKYGSLKGSLKGLDPLEVPAMKIKLNKEDIIVNFICINTAYFSDKDTSDEKFSPVPNSAIRSLLEDIDKDQILFIVGHHPPNWFMYDSHLKFNTILLERTAIYLHGHSHRIETNFNKWGISSFGIGASYQQTLDSTPVPYYQNIFAIVELDDYLHIAPISWDSENGKWRPHNNLPAEFNEHSSILENGYIFELPTTKLLTRTKRKGASYLSDLRRPPIPNAIIWLGNLTKERWLLLLKSFGLLKNVSNISLTSTQLPPGQIEFILTDGQEKNVIRAITAEGHVLSYTEVEAINTRFDTEDFDACLIISLGNVSEEARMLANRLNRRKAIQLLTVDKIIDHILSAQANALTLHINSLDAADVTLTYIMTDNEIDLLIQDKLKEDWFYIVSPNGIIFKESDPTVFSLRERRTNLKQSLYKEHGPENTNNSIVNSDQFSFSEEKYLEQCYASFNEIRYAPLAAIGVRFSEAKLNDIYIPANADISTENELSESFRRVLTDYLESLELDDIHRDQLESQLKDYYGISRLAETNAVRSLYQQFSNIIVLGDPGSGKTCFLKSEILNYSKRSFQEGSWYREHIPIYISLAEAARLTLSDMNLIEMCSTLAARRGLDFPLYHLEKYLSKGKIAFFFDGLDEVSALEQRAELMSKISNLIDQTADNGNRFVIASRPAAVQLVEMPKIFTTLQLRGLSNNEMRKLAENVLSARLTGKNERELGNVEKMLIDKLLEDCQLTAGIRRIAQNPLLLTLLVLIYANSGPLAAKRHRIYAQAVKTLVSVRNREYGEKVLSESDLRDRLGKLALAIYRRDISEIPSKQEVLNIIISCLKSEKMSGDLCIEASKFIQEVAEATGLLVIHQHIKNVENVAISFMHHSFLEYYAAVGFLSVDYERKISSLASNTRWHEIISLMTGILGDQKDITEFIKLLLDDTALEEKITKTRLLFSLECILETDVPSDKTQMVIAAKVDSTIRSGPALIVSDIREDLSNQLGKLLQSTGSNYIKQVLIDGISDQNPQICAAFIDITGRIGRNAQLGSNIVSAFIHACSRNENIIIISCLGAIERANELRTGEAIEMLKASFCKTFPVKFSAAKAVEMIPALAKRVWNNLKILLDDSHISISGTAARALLAGGLSVEFNYSQNRQFLEKCLFCWHRDANPEIPLNFRVTIEKEQLDELLASPLLNDRLLAIRILPLLDKEEKFVHDRIFSVLTYSNNHEELSASLFSLYLSLGAVKLITIKEAYLVCNLINDFHKDVRLGTIRVLSQFPTDEQVMETLCKNAQDCYAKGNKKQEYNESINSLIKHGYRNKKAWEFIINETLKHIPNKNRPQFGDNNEQYALIRLLIACENLGGIAPTTLIQKLKQLINNFRTPGKIRIQALRTFGRVVEPSILDLDFLISLFKNPKLANNTCSAILYFVKNCRRNLEYIRVLLKKYSELHLALVTRWEKHMPHVLERIDDWSMRDLRNALIEIENLVTSYNEFTERMKISSNDTKTSL